MPTILVVDDSAVERRLLVGLLEQEEGFTVEAADSGMEALDKLARWAPDLVITDLEMPEMTGLQLVKEIRVHRGGVPVILITAHGSEATAVEALREGAASYVPKAVLAETLPDAVRRVISIAEADRSSEELLACVQESKMHFDLENDPALIDPLIQFVQRSLRAMNVCDDTGRLQVGVALEHALLNALYRGNLELTTEELEAAREEQMLSGNTVDPIRQRCAEPPYCDRQIAVDFALSPTQAELVIRDEGRGFDVAELSKPPSEAMATGQEGRGIVLMQTLMDEVHFNETGNEVTLRKYCRNGEQLDRTASLSHSKRAAQARKFTE